MPALSCSRSVDMGLDSRRCYPLLMSPMFEPAHLAIARMDWAWPRKSHCLRSRLDSLAERMGLEPATPGVTGRYSNQLNYRSTVFGGC